MTNQHVKYEDFVMNTFKDNQQKPAPVVKPYTPPSLKGGYKNVVMLLC
jgi:hypothetical protein